MQDADAISSVYKRPKIIATQCIHIETVQNGNDTELTEENEGMGMNQSQADSDSCKEIEEEETENVLEEQDETQNKKQSQLNIDTIPNVTTESRVECEVATHINTKEQKQQEQSENSVSHIDIKDKRVEGSPKIIEKVRKKASQDNLNEWEEMDDDVLNSLSLFHDEVKSND